MPDENRFARLGEAIGESGDEGDAEEAGDVGEPESSAPARTDAESAEPTPETGPESVESEAEADDADGETTDDSADEAEEADEADDSSEETGGPAFEFEDTTAKSMYVRPETVAVLDDAEFEVESHLRREHDVRDLTGRELHDALVRVAAEYPEEVADAVLDAREETE